MSIELDVKDWLQNMRTEYRTSPPTFRYADWLLITGHVLNHYPCRPISERLIWRLFFIKPASYRTTRQGVNGLNRVFVFMEDVETNHMWRFTIELKNSSIKSASIRATVVSAYPKDLTSAVIYPDETHCCFSNSNIPKCGAFKTRISRMP